MARTVLTLLFLLGFSLISGSGSGAFAQVTDQAYIVHDVKVDTLAESAVKARDKAFGDAQTVAFKKLAARYYTAEELANFVPPDAKTVAGMVQDFELVSEQFSKKRYIGTYTFRFKANAVNRYFKRAPQYVEDAAPTKRAGLLVLPFFQQGTNPMVLWDVAKNPWLAAWQKTELGGNPLLVLPLGDVSDIMDVRDNHLSSYNAAGLKRMMGRYEARDAVLLVAKFEQNAKNPLTVDIYRTDHRKAELLKTIAVPLGSAKVLSQLLTAAVADTKEELAGNWKLETIVEDTPAEDVDVQPVVTGQPKPYTPLAGQVRVQTRFSNLNEWLAVRRSLNGIPSLTGVKIVALKSNEAIVDLTYADWSSLNSGLTSKGLTISGTGVGDYQLTRRPGMGEPTGTPGPVPSSASPGFTYR